MGKCHACKLPELLAGPAPFLVVGFELLYPCIEGRDRALPASAEGRERKLFWLCVIRMADREYEPDRAAPKSDQDIRKGSL